MSVVIDGTLGITSPAETVQGALTTTGNTILGDASTDTLTVGVTGIVKDASGNVGIGVSPNAAVILDVKEPDAAQDAIFRLAPGTGAAIQIRAIAQVDGTTSAMSFYTVAGSSSDERMRITSPGLLQFNSGYGSVATAYGCRAWVNFNGQGVVAIQASGNVSSITDNGVGDYTVNFTTAMVDANYAFSYACQYNHTGVATNQNIFPMMKDGLNMRSTTSLRFWTGTAVTTTYDCAVITASIIR